MKFTENWLRSHVPTTATREELIATLTAIGLEVEDVTVLGQSLDGVVVAQILSAEKHPEAANLKEKLKELAFSDSYHTYSLAHIFALEKENLLEPKKKTGEASRGKAEGGKVPQKIENIDEMSDKEFQQFSEKLSTEGTMVKIR